MSHEYVVRSYREGFEALDVMHHAVKYLTTQYRDSMTRAEAKAHFEARALLFRREMALLDEMELEYEYGASAEEIQP